MKKSTLVVVVIIIVLIIAGLWYINRTTETSGENQADPYGNAGQAPVLETDEQVFNEFDSAITGVE